MKVLDVSQCRSIRTSANGAKRLAQRCGAWKRRQVRKEGGNNYLEKRNQGNAAISALTSQTTTPTHTAMTSTVAAAGKFFLLMALIR